MPEGLEKIDFLRARLGVSYGEALAALDEAEGDEIAALAILEARKSFWGEKLWKWGRGFLAGAGEFFCYGNKVRLCLAKEEETILEMPLTLGLLGLLGILTRRELAMLAGVGVLCLAFGNNRERPFTLTPGPAEG